MLLLRRLRFLVEFETLVPVVNRETSWCPMTHDAFAIVFFATSAYHSYVIAPIAIIKEEHFIVGNIRYFANARKVCLRFVAVK